MKETPKPFTFINCAASVDGKLSSYERGQVRISNSEDLQRVDLLRAASDAVLVGMATVRSDDPKLNVKSEKLREERVLRGLLANPLKVAVGCVDDISLSCDFLDSGGEKHIFTTAASDPEKIRLLGSKAKIHVAASSRVDPADVLRTLSGLGVRQVMIEGGGTLNFEFLKEDLVDEMYVAYGPLVLGGREAPTMVDGPGFAADDAPGLKLIDSEVLGEVVVLRYLVKGARKYI